MLFFQKHLNFLIYQIKSELLVILNLYDHNYIIFKYISLINLNFNFTLRKIHLLIKNYSLFKIFYNFQKYQNLQKNLPIFLSIFFLNFLYCFLLFKKS